MPDTPSLAAALAALTEAAAAAGIDPDVARAEGEALAATVAESATGAWQDWSAQTGGDRSAEEFTTAASRGRRWRAGPTPSLAGLALARHPEAMAYATALSEVCTAAAMLGTPTPRVMGNASTAAAAQLGAVRQVARVPAGAPTGRAASPACPAPALTDDEMVRLAAESGRAVTDQLNAVRNALTKMASELDLSHLEQWGPGKFPGLGGDPAAPTPPTEPPTTNPDGTQTIVDRSGPADAGRRPTDQPTTPARAGARAAAEDARGAAGRARRARRPDGGQGRDPPTGRGAAHRGQAGVGRAQGAHHHPAPRLRRQPRHRQDHRGPAGGGDLSGARPAHQGPARRGRPLRAGRGLSRPDRDEDGRRGQERRRRGALHRRGLQPGRRPVRHRGGRHARQGDGGPPPRPGRDRRGLPRADGLLHRPEPRPGQPLPHHHRLRRLHRRRAGRHLQGAGHRRRLRHQRRGGEAVPRDARLACAADRPSATAATRATCSRPRSASTPGGCARSTSPPSSSCAR